MPISLQCPCDRKLRVKEELAGRKVRCPECKQILRVPAPEPEKSDEDEAANYLMVEGPPPKIKNANRRRGDEENDSRITSAPPSRRRSASEWEEEERPRRKKKSRVRLDDEERSSFLPHLAISPGIISGLLMMVGAVVWFVLGIVLIDRIFFYPPIMFVLGIGAVWRGLTWQGD
jgi:hypothetical protein